MKDIAAVIAGLGIVVMYLVLALGPTIAIGWVVIHFARKFW